MIFCDKNHIIHVNCKCISISQLCPLCKNWEHLTLRETEAKVPQLIIVGCDSDPKILCFPLYYFFGPIFSCYIYILKII